MKTAVLRQFDCGFSAATLNGDSDRVPDLTGRSIELAFFRVGSMFGRTVAVLIAGSASYGATAALACLCFSLFQFGARLGSYSVGERRKLGHVSAPAWLNLDVENCSTFANAELMDMSRSIHGDYGAQPSWEHPPKPL